MSSMLTELKKWIKSDFRSDLESSSSTTADGIKAHRSEKVVKIGSYNWSPFDSGPTIVVPGVPRIWNEHLKHVQLLKELKEEIVDENRARYPTHPLEPIFHAVKQCSPGFDFSIVDIVTDRNNLRKLLSFCAGTSSKSFTMNIGKVGDKTLLFERVEDEVRRTPKYAHFGYSFEKASGTSLLRTKSGSPASYRLISSYSLFDGQFNVVVRHEVDCVKFDDTRTAEVDETKNLELIEIYATDLDDEKYEISTTASDSKLVVILPREKDYSVSSVEDFFSIASRGMVGVELKTKSVRYAHEFDYGSAFGQMFFSGVTDNLSIAFHDRGYVTKPRNFEYDEIAEDARFSDEVEALPRLSQLLSDLKEIVFGSDIDEDGMRSIQLSYSHETRTLIAYRLPVSDIGCELIPRSVLSMINVVDY